MEALDVHKHPLEQIADVAHFVVDRLAGGAWAELADKVMEVPHELETQAEQII